MPREWAYYIYISYVAEAGKEVNFIAVHSGAFAQVPFLCMTLIVQISFDFWFEQLCYGFVYMLVCALQWASLSLVCVCVCDDDGGGVL